MGSVGVEAVGVLAAVGGVAVGGVAVGGVAVSGVAVGGVDCGRRSGSRRCGLRLVQWQSDSLRKLQQGSGGNGSNAAAVTDGGRFERRAGRDLARTHRGGCERQAGLVFAGQCQGQIRTLAAPKGSQRWW
jgi:hypothetical protein